MFGLHSRKTREGCSVGDDCERLRAARAARAWRGPPEAAGAGHVAGRSRTRFRRDSVILFLGIYSRKRKTYACCSHTHTRRLVTRMFVAALFIKTPACTSPRCHSALLHSMGCYPVTKRNGLPVRDATRGVALADTVSSRRSRAQKDTCCLTPFIEGSRTSSTNLHDIDQKSK